MSVPECALSDSLIRPLDQEPLLSIVIPTFNRPNELILTVQCIADQLKNGLEKKVELLITDNASDAETQSVIRALADRYPVLNFMFNAENQGGSFNVLIPAWRARGGYTWVFGSDDVLLDGGVDHIIGLLERESPSYLLVNKKVANSDLSELLIDNMHTVPDRRFETFFELFCTFGLSQMPFISANIEKTEIARSIDFKKYVQMPSAHPHLVGYLEKYAFSSAYYSSASHLIHRINNSLHVQDYHTHNFFDYAVSLPLHLTEAAQKIGLPLDFLEMATGQKNITSYDKSRITMVDGIFENILRAASGGVVLDHAQRSALEDALAHCQPHRLAQLSEVFEQARTVLTLQQQVAHAETFLDNYKSILMHLSQNYAA
jgi:glycosyltransferase involved in cell wall biosynthesis